MKAADVRANTETLNDMKSVALEILALIASAHIHNQSGYDLPSTVIADKATIIADMAEGDLIQPASNITFTDIK